MKPILFFFLLIIGWAFKKDGGKPLINNNNTGKIYPAASNWQSINVQCLTNMNDIVAGIKSLPWSVKCNKFYQSSLSHLFKN